MHDNGRYVKSQEIRQTSVLRGRVRAASALCAGVLALAPAAGAGAETIPGGTPNAAIALFPDSTAGVAFVSGPVLAFTSAQAGWVTQQAAFLPGVVGTVNAAVVDGRGRPQILVEDAGGRWLVLVRRLAGGWRTVRVAGSLPAGARLGSAGLASDRAGRPAIAYAVRYRTGKTSLRLVTLDARGRLHTRGVTRKGFPSSPTPPGAAPVLVGKRLRVIETYGSAGADAIEWAPVRRDWTGQFLYSTTRYGTPVGPVGAAAAAGTVYSAWSVDFSGFGKRDVVLATHDTRVRSDVLLDHASFVSLALRGTTPEVAADDWVDPSALGLPASAGDDFAGIVTGPARSPVELDGRLLGYAVGRNGRTHVLLWRDGALEEDSSPTSLALPGLELVTSPRGPDGSVALSGRIGSAVAGSEVLVYRERPDEDRVLVARVATGQNGEFTARDVPPSGPVLYRAVFIDPATGIPYGSLSRKPV